MGSCLACRSSVGNLTLIRAMRHCLRALIFQHAKDSFGVDIVRFQVLDRTHGAELLPYFKRMIQDILSGEVVVNAMLLGRLMRLGRLPCAHCSSSVGNPIRYCGIKLCTNGQRGTIGARPAAMKLRANASHSGFVHIFYATKAMKIRSFEPNLSARKIVLHVVSALLSIRSFDTTR